jgi:hypothetical protein
MPDHPPKPTCPRAITGGSGTACGGAIPAWGTTPCSGPSATAPVVGPADTAADADSAGAAPTVDRGFGLPAPTAVRGVRLDEGAARTASEVRVVGFGRVLPAFAFRFRVAGSLRPGLIIDTRGS